jgi:hypothetical protein
LATPAAGQDDLQIAIEAARQAWVAHRVAALLSESDTVRLQLPGVAEAASVKPGQASRLLGNYLSKSSEVSFNLRGVRRLAADHAYAELTRVFVVRGTTERQSETVFLGFRALGGIWRLREVRVTP